MSAVDLAALGATVVALAAAGIVVVALGSLVRLLRELRGVVEDLRGQALPLVADLRRHVEAAGDELDRVDLVLDRAERISATVDSATRLTHRALGTPVVKTLSLVAGAGRVSWRLRHRPRRRVLEVTSRPGRSRSSGSGAAR